MSPQPTHSSPGPIRSAARRSSSTRGDGRNNSISHPDHLWPQANLYRNPFGELTRQERAEVAVVPIDAMVSSLGPEPKSGQRIASGDGHPCVNPDSMLRLHAYQLIGRCGRGKTTHLLALAGAIPTASYVYLPEDGPCPTIPDGRPLLIDEAQRLPRAARRQVFASGIPLVLATHRDLRWKLRRFGYRVTTRRIGRELSPQHLSKLLNHRVMASRRDPSREVPSIGIDDCRELIRRFGTDIRRIEHFLYDVVQSQVHSDGQMRFID